MLAVFVLSRFASRPWKWATTSALRQDFEAQGSGNRRRFHELHRYGIAQAVTFAGASADHGVALFVITEIFVTDRASGHETVGASIAQFHEQACACDAGDPPVEARAYAICEKMRDQPIAGFPLSQHGAAFGGGNLRTDFGQRLLIGGIGQATVSELQSPDQASVHDQIGVASDRRREVRIATEVQAEMTIVIGRIFGLRLRARDDFVDEWLGVATLHARQNTIESFGLERAAFAEGDVERR